jgi:hypothetical protein
MRVAEEIAQRLDDDSIPLGLNGRPAVYEFPKIQPQMFIRNVMNGMIEGGDRVSFPPRARCPMKDDAVRRSCPFCPADLLHLVLKNFVGPDPVQKIVEPRIFRGEGETIRREGIGRVIARANIFTVCFPHRVGPPGATYWKSKRS